MITHVGHEPYNPLHIPSGIDEGYFNGRSEELNSIINNPQLKAAKLFNFRYAFRFKDKIT